MNFRMKRLPLLASAIALSLSIAPTLPAVAQSPSPDAPIQRDSMHRRNFLNLTPEQQAQMQQIWQNQREQINAILTDEQRAQLQQERENRRNAPREENQGPPGEGQRMRHSPFASLNLTDEQRAQIEAVKQSSREQMDAVLTPEQRQQLQEHLQQHQQRRTNSPAPDSPAPQTP